jgi:pilus assembly protein Flp/PilA
MPPDILRSIETGDAAVVHVYAVREPDKDSNLSRAPSHRRLNVEAALFAGASPIAPEQSSHIDAIKQILTIQRIEDARRRSGMQFASCTGIAQSKTKEAIMMVQVLKKFIADESGATAIEYGLIAAGISLAIIAAVNGIGAKLNTKFSSINSSLK